MAGDPPITSPFDARENAPPPPPPRVPPPDYRESYDCAVCGIFVGGIIPSLEHRMFKGHWPKDPRR